jgi:hypothetical protein
MTNQRALTEQRENVEYLDLQPNLDLTQFVEDGNLEPCSSEKRPEQLNTGRFNATGPSVWV